MRPLIAAAGAVVLLLAVTPGRALPLGPPVVSLSITPESANAFRIAAAAQDPDGLVSLTVCVHEGAEPVCRTNGGATASDPAGATLERLRACVEGSEVGDDFVHTFASEGAYRVTATATAGGCPVVGAEQTATTERTVYVVPPAPAVECADTGTPTATDVGVTESTVQVGTTVASTGPMAATTGAALQGIRAAIEAVNRTGGVCGRTLALDAYDDGMDAQRGLQYTQIMIAEGKFALVGMPSPYSLRAAILSGTIDAAGIPVVGTPGRTNAEFSSPWVWPVGPSSERYGRMMAKHAYEAGARRMAIVWLDMTDMTEARDGARAMISELEGAELGADRRVSLSDADFGPIITDVKNQCQAEGGDCDAILVILDAISAVKYFHSATNAGASFDVTEVAPYALSGMLTTNAVLPNGAAAVSGFALPGSTEGATRYENDMRSLFPDADTLHPYTEAAYAGTMAFARALGRAGVNLTRAGLRSVLDSEPFDLGVTATPLSWAAGKHANTSARAYQATYTLSGAFLGWRESGGWFSDE